MVIQLEIPNYELDDWIDSLKPYQQKIIVQLVDENGVEGAIDKWLKANGPCNTVKFGGESSNEDDKFSERFKMEINKFICGHPSYEKYREEYSEFTIDTKITLISSLSALLGAKLGVTAGALAPVIVLTLYLVGSMGRNAYCSIAKFD